MTTKRTPGPWTVNNGDMIWGPGEEFIAECIHEPYEANAALIAAAPDLLEACEKVLAAYDASKTRGYSTSPAEDRAAAQCREAIARAKGTASSDEGDPD
jgi:hypothetical protein